jgi:hypothetical protein
VVLLEKRPAELLAPMRNHLHGLGQRRKTLNIEVVLMRN